MHFIGRDDFDVNELAKKPNRQHIKEEMTLYPKCSFY